MKNIQKQIFLSILALALVLAPSHIQAAAGYTVEVDSKWKSSITEGATMTDPYSYSEQTVKETVRYIVRINTDPMPTDTVDVTISVTSGPCAILKVTSSSKGPGGPFTYNYNQSSNTETFNAALGVTARGFHVHAIDDNVYTGNRTCTVGFTTKSNDEAYAAVKPASQSFTVKDNETKPAPAPAPKPSQPPKDAAPEPPEIPGVILLDPSGNEIPQNSDDDQPVSFKTGEDVTISGKTVPNGEVKLYIFSEPREDTTTADENGDWTYTIKGLEAGDHRVEAEVTDPATGKTSERGEVLAFHVEQAEAAEESTATGDPSIASDDNNTNIGYLLAVIGFIVVSGLAGGYWWWKKRPVKASPTAVTTEETPTPETKPEDEDKADENPPSAK